MTAAAQRAVIEFLERPESYGSDIGTVERIDTHGAIVFLAGDRAYKLKREVRFPYMDYSTPERRRAMCEAELRLNRRTAPMLYEAVIPVTRDNSSLRLGGDGAPVDWLVVMRRFDQSGLFDRMAARGILTTALMVRLAEEIARFHAKAEPCPDFGGAAGIESVIDGNREGLSDAVFDRAQADRFDAACRAELARLRVLFDARRGAGFVRHCHGDLHLRNICLIDGRPVLFDAIEFNDQLACVDTVYDFAFLLMDLERRALRDLANATFNAYLDARQDYGALAALPLFLACRAGIKAQTAAAAARAQPALDKGRALVEEARTCLDLGARFLMPPPARMIAIGGLSGTGKSTIARLIAPDLGGAPGAVVLRSDVIRKRRAGVEATARLGSESYTPAANRAVYDALIASARSVAEAGHAVIVDAVFAKPAERAAIEEAARAARVPFTGLWLEAPHAQMAARIEARRGDASDATVEILRRQFGYNLGVMSWHRVDASDTAEATAARAQALVGSADPARK